MNYGRLVVAALAATVMDAAYGFVVWGQLLAGEFGYSAIFRPAGDMSGFVLMFRHFGGCAQAFIYASTKAAAALLRIEIGVVIGLLMVSALGRELRHDAHRQAGITYLIGGFGEWFVAGIVIGSVSRQLGGPASRRV
jgi:hypothetical protein